MAVDEDKLKAVWTKAADDSSELDEDELKVLAQAVQEGRLGADTFADEEDAAS